MRPHTKAGLPDIAMLGSAIGTPAADIQSSSEVEAAGTPGHLSPRDLRSTSESVPVAAEYGGLSRWRRSRESRGCRGSNGRGSAGFAHPYRSALTGRDAGKGTRRLAGAAR